MTASDASAGRARAQVRRRLARGARRLQHGRPTLSVIVQAVGGDPDRLRGTLASVRNQASPKIEILVVGNGGLLEAARGAAGDDTRVRFLTAASVQESRETGLQHSRGSHVVLAGPGDFYPPGVLAELIEGIEPDKAFLLTSEFAPRRPITLAEVPGAAGNPTTGRFLVPRARATAAVTGITDQDPDGLLTGLRLLVKPFRPSGWATYRNDRVRPAGPFVARTDPFPGLTARIDRDLATLDVLAGLPEPRAARGAGALRVLRPFLDAAEAASAEDWTRLAAHARVLRDATDGDLLAVPVIPRLLALLAADGRRGDLVRASAALTGEDFPTVISDDRVFADVAHLTGELDEDAFEVAPDEHVTKARATRLVVEGPVVRLELFVGVSHLDQAATDLVRVELLQDVDVLPMRVTLGRDAAVTRWMAETEHDHDDGLVIAEVDVADLKPGMHLLSVIWSDGVRETGTAVTELAETGSAARPPIPASADRSVGLHLRHGRVALGVTGSRPPSTGAVSRIETQEEALRLTVDREIDEVWLEGQGHKIVGERGMPGFWTVPLVSDPWGLGAAPLPTGSYAVRLAKGGRPVPATAAPVLLDALPEESRTTLHRAQVQRGDALTVRLDPLLTDEELGVRAQRRLQIGYAQVIEPLDPRLVYFQSFTGQWPGDHPLAIQAELFRRRPDLDVRWLVADSSATAPPGTRPVLFRSREWYDVLARASYLVTNIELEKFFVRREGQQVLQTFHGYPSKAMGLGLWGPRGLLPSQIEAQLDHTSRVWNNLLTPDPEMDQYYRRDYAYDGRILALGYPRNDVLIGPAAADLRTATRARLGIGADQRVVLYAPTWRDDLATNFRAAEAVHHLDVEKAAAALGEEYVLLMRGHRFHAPTRGSGSRVIDVTGHPDINHLIAASDAAVLDYSSLRFDFAITGKPMVFLVPDLETYGSATRGFLWDYRETAPGPLVADTADVVAELRDLDRLTTRWSADVVAFNARYNRLQDGRAAERVVGEFFAPLL